MGCQLNENDSEKISGMLEEMGYSKTDKIEDANVVAFNTCCVRENADDKLQTFLDIFDNAVVKYESDLKQGNYFFEFDGCMLYTHSSVVTTRKPSRIKPVIRKLEELWRKYPDLRLGQLLIDCAGDKDLFNLEDDELLEAMERFGDNL